MTATPLAGADAPSGRPQRDIGGGGKEQPYPLSAPSGAKLTSGWQPGLGPAKRLRRSALGHSRLVERTVAASQPQPPRRWLPRRARPHLNAADRQPGQPAGAPGDIKRVGRGRGAPSGAEQNLLRRPVVERVTDRRQRVGVADRYALKREADRVGQTADGGELALSARDAGVGVAHPVHAMQPRGYEQPDRTARELLTLDAYGQDGLRVGGLIGDHQHAVRRAIAASGQLHHRLQVAISTSYATGLARFLQHRPASAWRSRLLKAWPVRE